MSEPQAVLPLPRGDPEALQALAARLRLVLGRSDETVLARHGNSALGLAGLWSGPAFEAACAELAAAADALRDVGGQLLPAAGSLDTFAAELAAARRLVAGLQEEWQAADRVLEAAAAAPPPPLAGPAGLAALQAASAARERTRTDLLERHTRCVRALEVAEEQAAAAVLGVLGEAASPGRQRELLLGRLPLTSAALRRVEADQLVERALVDYDPDATTWTAAQLHQLLAALAGSADDPAVARALLARLGPDGLEHAARLLGTGGTEASARPLEWTDAPRRTLALAFATTVSDLPAGDPVTGADLEQWQARWVATLLERPLESLTAQVGLLALAARAPAPVVPSTGYAAGALRALLRADAPLHRQLQWRPGRPGGGLGSVLVPAPDGFDLLFSAVAADPARARSVLLSPGVHGRTLVHDLVAHRPFGATTGSAPATSSEALGGLLGQLATADPSAEQHRLREAVLDALGEAGARWWQLEGEDAIAVDRRLDPLRWPAGLLLAGDPRRVWDAVGPTGVDPDAGSAAARMQALLGEIGKDAPALSAVLATLAAFEADRLSERLASGNAPTSAPVAAATLRLGYVVGFTASSASVALTHAGQQHDTVSTRERAIAHGVVSFVDLLPLKSASPVGVVASAVLPPAEQLALRVVDSSNPVDHARRAESDAEALLGSSRHLVAQSAREAVRLRVGDDEAALTVVSLVAADQVRGGATAVNRAGPVPPRAP